MGLLLLIPGLVFLVNGTEWFSGEDAVGRVLTVIGIVLILVQVLWFAFVARQVTKNRDRFDLNDFRRF